MRIDEHVQLVITNNLYYVIPVVFIAYVNDLNFEEWLSNDWAECSVHSKLEITF
jgi:hypothetical protein